MGVYTSVSLFKEAGWYTFISCAKANSLTGENASLFPLPLGLSVWVKTAAISSPLSYSAFSDGTAKSGVPIKTIFIYYHAFPQAQISYR